MISLISLAHYHNQQKYSNIRALSEENKKRILEAKALRDEVKTKNDHELQCSGITENFPDSRGIIDPCYKKYVWK